jgi:hypothetical protein
MAEATANSEPDVHSTETLFPCELCESFVLFAVKPQTADTGGAPRWTWKDSLEDPPLS